MSELNQLLQNKVLLVAAISWLVAGVLKVIIEIIILTCLRV